VKKGEKKVNQKWDTETDVVVVGYGLGGGISAIASHDAGAKVLIMEKLPVPGGNSILSGGSVIFSLKEEDAFKYLKACSDERVSLEMIEFMAKGMTWMPDYLGKLADEADAVSTVMHVPFLFYPFPGKESFRNMRILGFKGQEQVSQAVQTMDMRKRPVSTRRGGVWLMQMVFRNVEKRNIEVMFSTAAERLVKDDGGRIIGVLGNHEGAKIAIKAKKGVILASGGFEFNDWLLKQYCEIQPIYPVGCKGDTGDGILMAQKAGAALWHMWLLHGSYGFKFPGYDYAFRVPFGGALNPEEPAKVVWILINRYGKRFMNEAIPFMQDASHRTMQSMNCDFLSTASGMPEYTHIPSYMIFDEEGRKDGPLAFPLTVLDEELYCWSDDNMAEIEKGWIQHADNIPELAGKIGADAMELQKTIDRWNSMCPEQKDTDFHRVPGSMVPINTPPYYFIECWPVVTNTQGGPQFNTKCQIIDPYGEPIPGLYKAGELGSFFGHLYTLGGNLSECVIEGRTAGENAAEEPAM
jgi:succinate dehydrogenase/fumarate reductase flavoprotein subunit